MRGDRPWLNRLHNPTLQLVSGRVELRKAGLGRSVQLEEPCVKAFGQLQVQTEPRVLHSPIDSLYRGHLTGFDMFLLQAIELSMSAGSTHLKPIRITYPNHT